MGIRNFIRRHKRLRRIARFILRRKPNPIVYSWDDVNMMTNDWCRFLPDTFDCVIGIPRGGLVIANQIALNLGLPLSTPFNFMLGDVWQSRNLPHPQTFSNVLIVDDYVDKGRELMAAVAALRNRYPDTVFEVAALVKAGPVDLDYCYVVDDAYVTFNDLRKWGCLPYGAHIVYDDLV